MGFSRQGESNKASIQDEQSHINNWITVEYRGLVSSSTQPASGGSQISGSSCDSLTIVLMHPR
jgi:hypothetical protein